MTALLSVFMPVLTYLSAFAAYLTEGVGNSIADILSAAGEMFTWFISQMGALITVITANPIILVMFLILLCGAVVGMFMRIWKSA